MLHVADQTGELRQGNVAPPPEPQAFSWLPLLFGFLRRRWPIIAITAGLILSLGVAYILTASPLYTATTRLLIDTEQSTPFQNRAVVAESQAENALVESQVEVLRSEDTARAVVERLALARSPEFRGKLAEEGDDLTIAAELLQRSIVIRRIGLSYIIEISVTSRTPGLSARIAKAVTDTYFERQLQARQATSQRAGVWLQDRLRELRDQAIAADRAVQDYRARNNIVGTDRGLINEQQLGEINGQLAAARARLTDAQSRLERIQSISPNGLTEGSVSEALQNTVIVGLRQRYLDAARREAEFAGRYGPNHTAAVNLRAEMAELQRAIQSEFNRIRDTYRSDYEVARSNVTSLEQQFNRSVGTTAETNESRVILRALEQAAETYRMLYSNFLQRYTQAVQDQSFPITNARVVEEARPPRRKSHPRSAIVLAGAAVAGLTLGCGLAVLRELSEGGVRTPAQLTGLTGLPCLGAVGKLRVRRVKNGDGILDPTGETIGTGSSPLRAVLEGPDKLLTDTMWSLRLHLDRRRKESENAALVVGFVSALPREGATTLAANFAQSLASTGSQVVLLDLDLEERTLTNALSGATGPSIPPSPLRDPHTGLLFQPTPQPSGDGGAARHQALREARARIRSGLSNTEYIILDLPPVLSNLETLALADEMDATVLVVRWGRTSTAAVTEAAARLSNARVELVGVVLNRAKISTMRRYGVLGLPR